MRTRQRDNLVAAARACQAAFARWPDPRTARSGVSAHAASSVAAHRGAAKRADLSPGRRDAQPRPMKHLTPKEAHDLLAANPQAVFVDCRSEMEYFFVGHPVGAQHVAWNDGPDWEINPHFVGQVKKVASMNRPIVLICRSGHRSVDAGPRAREGRVHRGLQRARTASKARSTTSTIAARGPAGAWKACRGSSCRELLMGSAGASRAEPRLLSFGMAWGSLAALFHDAAQPRAPDAEIAGYAALAQECGGLALDVMCGAGRVLVPLLAHGVKVHGVDQSPSMLARCEEKLAAQSASTLFRQDVAQMNLPFRYGGAFVAGGAFDSITDPAAAGGGARAHPRAPRRAGTACVIDCRRARQRRVQRLAAPLVEVRTVRLDDASQIVLRSETTWTRRRAARRARSIATRTGAARSASPKSTRRYAARGTRADDIVEIVRAAGFRDVATEPCRSHRRKRGEAFALSRAPVKYRATSSPNCRRRRSCRRRRRIRRSTTLLDDQLDPLRLRAHREAADRRRALALHVDLRLLVPVGAADDQLRDRDSR